MNKAERLGLAQTVVAFLFLLAALASYTFLVRPWFLHWGAEGRDRTRPLLGDDAWIGGAVTGTRAVTVDAPPEKIWPWLVQIGQERAGFYSYTWLENLALADIHNTLEIRPEWQARQAKDFVRAAKRGYLFGLIKEKERGSIGWPVSFVAPGQAMTLRNWGTFAAEPYGEGRARFLIRSRGEPLPGVLGRLVGFWVLDPAHFIMEKKMMTEIKRLAEGRPGPPAWRKAAATAGFAAAAVGSALVIVSKRRKRFWLLLPAAAAALILRETADLAAALAGFTALGLAITGFLVFKKRWWVYFGFMTVFSYAVLFLAADAWIVFGLAFLVVSVAEGREALKGVRRR
jgi:hypothetical protein